jgi:hypothetical protein
MCFIIPFILAPQQLINGTIVNAALFLSAIMLPKKYFLPAILFPSLATLSRGLIFGTLTPFLAYFVPFIWLANWLLVLAFKKTRHFGFVTAVILASSLKYLFLVSASTIYFRMGLVPKIFLNLMGNMQLITALFGGLAAFLVFKTVLEKHE